MRIAAEDRCLPSYFILLAARHLPAVPSLSGFIPEGSSLFGF
jgi:hypothetical protein